MTGFPDGPGADLSGVFIPGARCGRLGRLLGEWITLARRAGAPEPDPLVLAHVRQLRFAGDRFSASAIEDMQVSPCDGNAEFRGAGDPAGSERKPGLSTTQVARMLEMSPRSVLNLIYRGSLTGTRSGRGWMVDMGSAAELCEARRKEKDEREAA